MGAGYPDPFRPEGRLRPHNKYRVLPEWSSARPRTATGGVGLQLNLFAARMFFHRFLLYYFVFHYFVLCQPRFLPAGSGSAPRHGCLPDSAWHTCFLWDNFPSAAYRPHWFSLRRPFPAKSPASVSAAHSSLHCPACRRTDRPAVSRS